MSTRALPSRDRLIDALPGAVLRYGLAAIILWFGAFKFTAAEAAAIEPLLRNSPLLSWMYAITDVRGASRLIGSGEIIIALLLAARPLSAGASFLGGLGATAMFVTTLSFLVTTPGMFALVEGFPAPSGAGGFIMKDVILLGAAMWAASDSYGAMAVAAPPARNPAAESSILPSEHESGILPSEQWIG